MQELIICLFIIIFVIQVQLLVVVYDAKGNKIKNLEKIIKTYEKARIESNKQIERLQKDLTAEKFVSQTYYKWYDVANKECDKLRNERNYYKEEAKW